MIKAHYFGDDHRPYTRLLLGSTPFACNIYLYRLYSTSTSLQQDSGNDGDLDYWPCRLSFWVKKSYDWPSKAYAINVACSTLFLVKGMNFWRYSYHCFNIKFLYINLTKIYKYIYNNINFGPTIKVAAQQKTSCFLQVSNRPLSFFQVIIIVGNSDKRSPFQFLSSMILSNLWTL